MSLTKESAALLQKHQYFQVHLSKKKVQKKTKISEVFGMTYEIVSKTYRD